MDKIRALIVDDEPIAREGLRTLLAAERDIEVIGECGNGRQAVKAIREQSPDLVFLDVQMPQMDGFDVIDEIGASRMPAVVFVTAYDQYALKAFEINAMDYLAKPFDEERLQKTLERARRFFQQAGLQELQQRLGALLQGLEREAPKQPERFVLKSAGRISFVTADEIDWIEAAGNYVRLHVGRESHLLRETMNAIADRLDPAQFLRIRRSVIVRIDRIKQLQPLFKGEYLVTLKDGTDLTSSRRYRESLSPLLGTSS
jgi:two-component system LytT family response regulator